MSIYARLFAWMYDPFMERFEVSFLTAWRRKLLGGLRGDILEVGAGTGINFGYYPAGTRVLACEPALDMYRRAQAKLSDPVAADISLIQAGVGDASLYQSIQPQSLDAVVCTLVLCTVPDPQAALALFRHWLKPGGLLLVLEHIKPEQPGRSRLFQFIQPAWGCLAEGCQLCRPTGQQILDAGFVPVWEERVERGLPFLVGTYTN